MKSITWKVSLTTLLILLAAPVQAEYFYARLGLGESWSNLGWENQDSIGGGVGVGYRHQMFDTPFYGDLAVTHYSQPFVGLPFNDDQESGSTHLFYWIEWRVQ